MKFNSFVALVLAGIILICINVEGNVKNVLEIEQTTEGITYEF